MQINAQLNELQFTSRKESFVVATLARLALKANPRHPETSCLDGMAQGAFFCVPTTNVTGGIGNEPESVRLLINLVESAPDVETIAAESVRETFDAKGQDRPSAAEVSTILDELAGILPEALRIAEEYWA